jgi:hypothetical protein
MRRRDYQKGLDVVLWLLGAISEEELKERIKQSRESWYIGYSEEHFPGKYWPEL